MEADIMSDGLKEGRKEGGCALCQNDLGAEEIKIEVG
jgi:hypothetical protein